MIQLAVVAAVAAVLGAAVAITARNGIVVALGLFVAMCTAPLASSPEPSDLAIAFRILGALLGAYLLGASARSQSIASEGSGVGIVPVAAVAAAAFVAGWFVTPVKPLAGPLAAQAAGVALVALAVVPLAGRDLLRAGGGVTTLALGVALLLQAWVGTWSSLQQIVMTALLVGIVGATSLLVSPVEIKAPTKATAPARRGAQAPDAGVAAGRKSDEPKTQPLVVAAALPAAAPAQPVESRKPVESARPVESRPGAEDLPTAGSPAPASATRARRLRPREPRQ